MPPTTTAGMLFTTMAPQHMGQGSRVVYRVQPAKFRLSVFDTASRMAVVSAWPSGSLADSRWLPPRPMTTPSLTMTAPTARLPPAPALLASSNANSMNSSCSPAMAHPLRSMERITQRWLELGIREGVPGRLGGCREDPFAGQYLG